MKHDSEKVFEALVRKHLTDSRSTAKSSEPCPDENMVSAYLEGNLAEYLRMDLERHLSECLRCQEELSLLVKSQEVPSFLPTTTGSLGTESSGWLVTFQAGLTWLSNLGARPVLAVLAVTLISGYIGVQLFQQERRPQQTATELTGTVRHDRGVAEDNQSGNGVSESKNEGAETMVPSPQAASEQLREKKEGYAMNDRDAIGVDSGEANPEARFRHVYSPVPPESSEVHKPLQLGGKSKGLVGQEVETRLPEASLQEPSSVVVRKDSRDEKAAELQLPVSGRVAMPQSSNSQNQPASVHSQLPVASKDQVDPIVADKQRLAKKLGDTRSLAVTSTARGQLKGGALPDPRSEGDEVRLGNEEQPQLRVADKIFELRNNVWTDLSIDVRETKQADVTISKNSSNYREQVKSLSAYDSVLSRNEDCLVEFQGKIFFIRNSR